MGRNRKKAGAGGVTAAPTPPATQQTEPVPLGAPTKQNDMPDVNETIRELRAAGFPNFVGTLLKNVQDADMYAAMRDFDREQRDEYTRERTDIPPSVNPSQTILTLSDRLRRAAANRNGINRATIDMMNDAADMFASGQVQLPNRMANTPYTHTFEPVPTRIASETIKLLFDSHLKAQRARNLIRDIDEAISRYTQQGALTNVRDLEAQRRFLLWEERAAVRGVEAAEARLQANIMQPAL
jgi:hypothetical protein